MGNQTMGTLKVERVGGLAGFGASGSRLRSEGEKALSDLSSADQAKVEDLFSKTAKAASQAVADGFRYRITRSVGGQDQTVEVPEAVVPEALRNCVTDKLD
jgi:hypothetical protein